MIPRLKLFADIGEEDRYSSPATLICSQLGEAHLRVCRRTTGEVRGRLRRRIAEGRALLGQTAQGEAVVAAIARLAADA